jgi:hypothetical protein
LYAGLRSMPHTVERSQRPRCLQVGIACSFKWRAMAPILRPLMLYSSNIRRTTRACSSSI